MRIITQDLQLGVQYLAKVNHWPIFICLPHSPIKCSKSESLVQIQYLCEWRLFIVFTSSSWKSLKYIFNLQLWKEKFLQENLAMSVCTCIVKFVTNGIDIFTYHHWDDDTCVCVCLCTVWKYKVGFCIFCQVQVYIRSGNQLWQLESSESERPEVDLSSPDQKIDVCEICYLSNFNKFKLSFEKVRERKITVK